MELSHSYVQFVFNVIIITTVTSVSAMWILLKRDTIAKLPGAAKRADPARNRFKVSTWEVSSPGLDGSSASVGRQDIRQFVRHRADRWTAQSASVRMPENCTPVA